VPADWGIYPNVFNLEELTFNFIEDVLAEVLALFPGRYIHKGGDEVQRDQWKDSPRTQARMRELGIADPAQLQAYFTTRIARFLAANGRRLVGWDEILEPALPRSAVVMWRGIDGAITASSEGYDTVLAPDPDLYFDNWQSREPDEPSGRMKALVSLESVYRFDPMPGKVAEDRRHHVLGLQGNVWTEHIRTEERVAWMTFPRAAAVAEVGWSAPERRDWRGFLRRLAAGFGDYEKLGITPADSAFAVHGHARYRATPDHAEVELSTPSGFGEIHYTVDGTPPSAASAPYAGPLSVAIPGEVRAASFDGERRLSRMRAFPIRREASQRRSSRELELCSQNIPLAVEDDAPLKGPRASFGVDIMNPCWIYRDADLDAVKGLAAAVGQVPFNYQIGEDIRKIVLAHPHTPAGELEVHLGKCDGELLARLPLAPASASHAVTVLPRAALRAPRGKHDLCLRFAQPGLDPLWVIDWVQLVEEAP
jgi:hexosaminidase